MNCPPSPPQQDDDGPVADQARALIAQSHWSDPQFALAITDRAALRHTCYVELCPDFLRKRPAWNDGGLFFTQETFAHLLAPALPDDAAFDIYSFHDYGPDIANHFTAKLRALASNLAAAGDSLALHGYWFCLRHFPADAMFAHDFSATRNRLLALTDTTACHLERWLQRGNRLHVLGL